MANWNKKIQNDLIGIKKMSLESWFYLLIVGILFLSYLVVRYYATRVFENEIAFQEVSFGFSQLKVWRFRNLIFISCIFLLILFFSNQLKSPIRLFFEYLERRPWRVDLFIVLSTILMTTVFLLFSTNFINEDGRHFQAKFERDVPTLGAHITHDEMWELYFHSRFWFYTNKYFGWDVKFSYRVVSCLMGGIFIFALLKYARQKFSVGRWFGLALLICSGGYMQLFFGEVENYSMTAVLLFFYLWSSDLYIQRKTSLLAPSIIMSIALGFHLLSGFFLPSLVYLYILAIQRRQFRFIILSSIISTLIILLNLVYFSFHGLPISDLWTNSIASGKGGSYSMFLVSPNVKYYFQIVNLFFLLVPSFIFILPLAIFKRIVPTATNIHLLISIAGVFLLTLGWKAQLGVYNDWNLFAVTALPVSLLVWNNFDNILEAKLKSEIALIAGFIFFFHSWAWIMSNHLMGR